MPKTDRARLYAEHIRVAAKKWKSMFSIEQTIKWKKNNYEKRIHLFGFVERSLGVQGMVNGYSMRGNWVIKSGWHNSLDVFDVRLKYVRFSSSNEFEIYRQIFVFFNAYHTNR